MMSDFWHVNPRDRGRQWTDPRVEFITAPADEITALVAGFMDHPDRHITNISSAEPVAGPHSIFCTVTIIYQAALDLDDHDENTVMAAGHDGW